MRNQIALPKINIVSDDVTIDVNGTEINYNVRNPLTKLMSAMEEASFFAEDLNFYLTNSIQYLFPFTHLELYGPSGEAHVILDPRQQDVKTDFQKQNIRDFTLADCFLVRGWVSIGNTSVPFLKISYLGGPDSILSQKAGNQLSSFIFLWLKVQGKESPGYIKVPYNEQTDRYEVEIWGHPSKDDISGMLTEKGKASLNRESLLIDNSIIRGSLTDFDREGLDGLNMYERAAENTMHPILPLKIQLAWTDHTKGYWDSQDGKNYSYEFNMIVRGWDNYMEVGVSGSPHGGIGFLHYRNLLSNYKPYSVPSELSRTLLPWMFDINGNKSNNGMSREEKSLAVDYLDLHILKGECGIGIHRHRDNQEIFFLLNGKAYMMVGDWYQFPDRERAFEIRTLLPGSLALLKPGQLHSLINALDIDATLLMFGGYD
jgi:mannose-6-phosphate isomerase-like protein (cupin superfamily)